MSEKNIDLGKRRFLKAAGAGAVVLGGVAVGLQVHKKLTTAQNLAAVQNNEGELSQEKGLLKDVLELAEGPNDPRIMEAEIDFLTGLQESDAQKARILVGKSAELVTLMMPKFGTENKVAEATDNRVGSRAQRALFSWYIKRDRINNHSWSKESLNREIEVRINTLKAHLPAVKKKSEVSKMRDTSQ